MRTCWLSAPPLKARPSRASEAHRAHAWHRLPWSRTECRQCNGQPTVGCGCSVAAIDPKRTTRIHCLATRKPTVALPFHVRGCTQPVHMPCVKRPQALTRAVSCPDASVKTDPAITSRSSQTPNAAKSVELRSGWRRTSRDVDGVPVGEYGASELIRVDFKPHRIDSVYLVIHVVCDEYINTQVLILEYMLDFM